MPPTMEDVAHRAGVSKATVSLVLNRKPGVSPETQQAVLQVAEEIGYRLPERRVLRPQGNRSLAILHYVEDESRNEPYGSSSVSYEAFGPLPKKRVSTSPFSPVTGKKLSSISAVSSWVTTGCHPKD